jgi:hypothetical protein
MRPRYQGMYWKRTLYSLRIPLVVLREKTAILKEIGSKYS